MSTIYPCVPSHEIVGRVVNVGSAVKKFKEGDIAAVGCMVDSCRKCPSCLAGEEQCFENFATLTYNSEDKFLGGVTYGGYSNSIVVEEAFVLRVPNGLDTAGTAPLPCAGSFDFILDTVSADHDLNAYLQLLKLDGTMTLVGAPPKPLGVASFNLIMKRRHLAGSTIGGIRETQEMLDFCAEKGITADIGLIRIQKINEAYEHLLKSDVKYWFVIDMASLK